MGIHDLISRFFGQLILFQVEWTISPEFAEDGTTIRTLTTCGNNISHLKWAEIVQRSRVEEALEAKRQQEKYAPCTALLSYCPFPIFVAPSQNGLFFSASLPTPSHLPPLIFDS